MILILYSSMKKKIGRIQMIFDIENWLWKSEFCDLHDQILVLENCLFVEWLKRILFEVLYHSWLESLKQRQPLPTLVKLSSINKVISNWDRLQADLGLTWKDKSPTSNIRFLKDCVEKIIHFNILGFSWLRIQKKNLLKLSCTFSV